VFDRLSRRGDRALRPVLDSTIAYQAGRNGDIAALRRGPRRPLPHLTLLLDCLVASARLQDAADRYHALDGAFHERVRAGFLALAEAEPERVRRVDASADIAQVRDEIAGIVDAWLAERTR
jgi:dTMP kinase